MNNIKIIALNVNSLNRCVRRRMFIDFISENDADIYLLSETKFGHNNNFSLNGYKIFRNDRKIGAGGVAIVFKNQFKFKNILTYNYPMEGISIDFFIDDRWIRIFSIYFITIDPFKFQKQYLSNCKCQFVIGGDFNARNVITGDDSNNFNGIALEKIVQANDINWKFPMNFTCFRSITGSKIDHFLFSKNFPFDFNNTTVLNSFSDHMAVENSFKISQSYNLQYDFIYLFDKINVKKMNEYVDKQIQLFNIPFDKNLSDHEIDKFVNKLDDLFGFIVKKFVPTTKIKINNIKLSTQTLNIKSDLKRRYRFLKRNGINSTSISFRDQLVQYKLLKICFINSLKFDIKKFYMDKLKLIENTSDVFGHVKKFTAHKKRERIPEILFANEKKNNENFIGHDKICNELANRFQYNNNIPLGIKSNIENDINVDLTNNDGNMIHFDDYIRADISNETQMDEINKLLPEKTKNILTSSTEIGEIIKNRPNKKSFGDDKIPYFIIKRFSPNFILFLTILFNHLLANSYFPNKWKLAKITPIPKISKDKQLIENWRPISNLFSISKIFEKIVLNRLIDGLRELNIFEWQFGFRKSYSTIHPLSIVQNEISNGLNGGNFTSLVSLDLKAAFDTVWKDGLVFKMNELKINIILIRLINNFLTDRRFFVSFERSKSDIKNMLFGVPQGSCLSPFLFNIYVHDIPRVNGIKFIQYADDILLFHTGNDIGLFQNRINILLLRIGKWFNNWKLKVNENKTVWINIVGNGRDINRKIKKSLADLPICFNGFRLRPTSQLKYLGLIFNTKNNFNGHVYNIVKRTNGALQSMKMLIRSKNIDVVIKNNIYKIYLRPIISYASPVWSIGISSSQFEKIRLLERKIIRPASNFYRERNQYYYKNNQLLYQAAGIDRIDRFVVNNSISFIEKCKNHFDEKISNLANSVNGDQNFKYKNVNIFHKLNDQNQLFVDDKILYFHTGYYDSNKLVYNINQ